MSATSLADRRLVETFIWAGALAVDVHLSTMLLNLQPIGFGTNRSLVGKVFADGLSEI